MGGQLLFKVHLTPPNAAKALVFEFTYDPDLLDGLFE
jgi:hypothetical protein